MYDGEIISSFLNVDPTSGDPNKKYVGKKQYFSIASNFLGYHLGYLMDTNLKGENHTP